jgi:hypothetical protein
MKLKEDLAEMLQRNAIITDEETLQDCFEILIEMTAKKVKNKDIFNAFEKAYYKLTK